MKNLFLGLFLATTSLSAQTIGTFNSVTPTAQTQEFVLPSTHRFQKLVQEDDAYTTGGGTLKPSFDFTCYVPISGSSTNGYISLNHEYYPGAVSILDVNYNNTTKLWAVTNSQLANLSAATGFTIANCSGGLTPWGNVLSGEEVVLPDAHVLSGLPADGYNDAGWLLEINPVTRQGVRKLWAAGCGPHENAAVAANGTLLYTGFDNFDHGFLYKYVFTTANNPTSGNLYVLKLTSNGNGDWVQIANTTQNDQNNTIALSVAVGATNISGVEDVEIGPDGKIYVAAKFSQQVYRFTDNGTTVSNYETYVSAQCYTFDATCEPYSYAGDTGNDNLAFDGEGNLWILQDGGRNHIWVVGPSHTPGGTNDVRLFATTPVGSEPTGITFTPDYKFMFISLQHPSGSNSTPKTDAAGNVVVFNKATMMVVARQEFLGTSSLPIELQDFTAHILNKNKVSLKWLIQDRQSLQTIHIERSFDGSKFDKIGAYRTPQYQDYFVDEKPFLSKNYYRLRFVEKDGTETFSKIVSAIVNDDLPQVKATENPFSHTTIVRYSNLAKNAKYLIFNTLGALIESKNLENTEGALSIGEFLKSGIYFLKIVNNNKEIETVKLIKTE